MSTKKHKKKVPPSRKAETAVVLKPQRDYSIFITAAFFIVALVGILHHEMWRDEYQAWLVARDSHSFSELLKNHNYEGHPLLWYVILYGLTSITTDPFYLQFINLLFGTTAVWIFCRYSPFNTIQKILFSFGYYTLYEYTLITRYHALALMFIVLFCTLYKNRKKNYPWMFLILFLLANTSLINNVVAIALSGILVLDFLLNHKKEEWKGNSKIMFSAGIVFVAAGVLLSAMFVMPEDDNMFKPSMDNFFVKGWIKELISRIDNAFLLFRDLFDLPTWAALAPQSNSESDVSLHFFISIVFLISISAVLLRKPLALLFYWTGSIALLLIYGISYLVATRYVGHLFLVLLISLWLNEYFREFSFKSSFMNFLARFGSKLKPLLIFLIFGFQVAAAAGYYMTDIMRPFSASRDAAEFIREQKLDTMDIVGTTDFTVSDFSALLNKQIFYPEIGEFGTYIVWTKKRKPPTNFGEVIPMFNSLLKNDRKKLLLIINYKLSYQDKGENIMLEHTFLSDSLKIDLIKHFDKAMVRSENYSLYFVERYK